MICLYRNWKITKNLDNYYIYKPEERKISYKHLMCGLKYQKNKDLYKLSFYLEIFSTIKYKRELFGVGIEIKKNKKNLHYKVIKLGTNICSVNTSKVKNSSTKFLLKNEKNYC